MLVNKNYMSGRRFEYQTMKILEKNGYTALRTAGSHGFADVIAFNEEHVRFIQCKCIKNAEKQRKTIITQFRDSLLINKTPYFTLKEVWIKDKTTGKIEAWLYTQEMMIDFTIKDK